MIHSSSSDVIKVQMHWVIAIICLCWCLICLSLSFTTLLLKFLSLFLGGIRVYLRGQAQQSEQTARHVFNRTGLVASVFLLNWDWSGDGVSAAFERFLRELLLTSWSGICICENTSFVGGLLRVQISAHQRSVLTLTFSGWWKTGLRSKSAEIVHFQFFQRLFEKCW